MICVGYCLVPLNMFLTSIRDYSLNQIIPICFKISFVNLEKGRFPNCLSLVYVPHIKLLIYSFV